MRFKALILATALASAATFANAATVVVPPVTYGPAKTNWSTTLSVPKFNPALGTLTAVSYSFIGSISGSIGIESLDAAAATITANLGSNIVLTLANGSTATASPAVARTFAATAFDGASDFGGTSGITYSGLSGSQTATGNPVDLADYTGSGNLSLAVTAAGTSSATGAGNLISNFQTNAAAELDVVYTYTPTVVTPPAPEPATIAVLGAGLLGLGVTRRARR